MTESVYESLKREAWEHYLEKDPEQTFADFLKGLHPQHRVAMVLSVLKSDVFNGGFDQWILNHRLDVDTDLRNVIQNVLGHWKSTVRTSVLPSLVVDLVRCALSWYDDQTTDRDTELDALDQKFYDLAGEDAVNYNADVETYLFLLGQSQGTAEEKIDRPA